MAGANATMKEAASNDTIVAFKDDKSPNAMHVSIPHDVTHIVLHTKPAFQGTVLVNPSAKLEVEKHTFQIEPNEEGHARDQAKRRRREEIQKDHLGGDMEVARSLVGDPNRKGFCGTVGTVPQHLQAEWKEFGEHIWNFQDWYTQKQNEHQV